MASILTPRLEDLKCRYLDPSSPLAKSLQPNREKIQTKNRGSVSLKQYGLSSSKVIAEALAV
jgi:hypothetical protein